MRIYKDEIFGPVLSSLRVGTYDEALALVNEHEFGNGAAIFTATATRRAISSSACRSEWVGCQRFPFPVPVAFHSFGGWKSSLFGDHHYLRPGKHPLLYRGRRR
jgi:malonate-semialdehyde dehydrogenase (acetylating)/methylmalonate-semialdehyde dehydrogenase